MPLSKSHKARTRVRILKSAGKLFRGRGYDGVSIDEIMKAVKLTRGGFYAHFPSKSALFTEVISRDHDLLERLESRDGSNKQELSRQADAILRAYLDPAHFEKIAPNCTMAALSVDALKAGKDSRAAFNLAIQRCHKELARGADDHQRADIWPKIVLAIGTLTLARVVEDQQLRNEMLQDCQQVIGAMATPIFDNDVPS